MLRLWWICVLSTISLFATPENRTIVIEMGMEKGYPPYRYMEEGKPKGIMYEVMVQMALREKLNLEAKTFVKRRHELALEHGLLDVVPTSRKWVSHSGEHLFTDNIVDAEDVIIMRREKAFDYQNHKDLFGKQMIGVLGYRYPVLKQYVQGGKITRYDTTNEKQMFLMLDKDRADFGVINKLVAKWMIKSLHLQGKYLLSAKDVGIAQLGFMFSKHWKSWIPRFNAHIKSMHDDGTIRVIINRYTEID